MTDVESIAKALYEAYTLGFICNGTCAPVWEQAHKEDKERWLKEAQNLLNSH